MSRWKFLLYFLLVAALASNGEGQKLTDHQPLEQTSFGAEAAPGQVLIRKPIKIPDKALQLLRDTLSRGALNCIKSEGLEAEQVPASWFAASEIHLDGANDVALVIEPAELPPAEGSNRCILGAHAVPFWVLGNTHGRYRLLLATDADGLEILDSRTNGYRDVHTFNLTATSETILLFKFYVAQYQLSDKTASGK